LDVKNTFKKFEQVFTGERNACEAGLVCTHIQMKVGVENYIQNNISVP